jgi:UDP-glucose 4-epimerase
MIVGLTGYSGYVGSFLLDKLFRDDNIKFIYCFGRKQPNIKSLKIKYLKINKLNNLKKIIKLNKVVFAAGGNENLSRNYEKSHKNTVEVLINFLNSKKIFFKSIIYLSTAQVYGDQFKINENLQARPKNFYGISHLHAEDYLSFYCKNVLHKNFTILRPFNIFGPSFEKPIKRLSLVPTCFCLEAIQKGSITLLSSGRQYRDFISLNQFYEKLKYIILNGTKFQNKIVNICSGQSIKIIDMARICSKLLNIILNKKIKILIKSSKPFKSNKLHTKSVYFKKINKKLILKEIEDNIYQIVKRINL